MCKTVGYVIRGEDAYTALSVETEAGRKFALAWVEENIRRAKAGETVWIAPYTSLSLEALEGMLAQLTAEDQGNGTANELAEDTEPPTPNL